jgi:hypothetical protein
MTDPVAPGPTPYFPPRKSFRQYLETRPIRPDGSFVDYEPDIAKDPDKRFWDRERNTAAVRESLDTTLDHILNEMELELGERWLGETTTAFDPFQRFHVRRESGHLLRHGPNALDASTYEELEAPAVEYLVAVLKTLRDPSKDGYKEGVQASTESQALMLLKLGNACDSLWGRSLSYKTFRAVCDAVDEFSGSGERQHGGAQQPGERSSALVAAAASAHMTFVDSLVFKQINRGSPDLVLGAIADAVAKLSEIARLLTEALEEPHDPALTDLLRAALEHCCPTKGFYLAIEKATLCLRSFEAWMEEAPRFGSVTPGAGAGGKVGISTAVISELIEGISELDSRLKEVEQDASAASRFEPWRQLLSDALKRLLACNNVSQIGARVFVPKTVLIRYCFPFAVDYSHGKRHQEDVEDYIHALDPDLTPHAAALGEQRVISESRQPGLLAIRLKEELSALFPEFQTPEEKSKVRSKVRSKVNPEGSPKVTPLAVSAFWLGSGFGLYGGKRVQLPNVTIGGTRDDETGKRNKDGTRHQVWLEISRMGNHALCIEPLTPLAAGSTEQRTPFPHEVYRALRTGTPWALGQEVWAEVDGENTGPWWESVHMFARDVVLAVASALTEPIKGHKDPTATKTGALPPYMPGNLHEVVLVQTDVPISGADDVVAGRLDNIMGARVLVTSVNRIASTLEEWLRSPAPSGTYGEGASEDSSDGRIAPLPFIGFAGDWFANTGDTTVFGIVAVPDWLRLAYFEVGQFAASWVPLLQLWSSRLQEAIRTAHSGDQSAESSERLRIVDQGIRRQTSELQSAQLCQSELHRRFLDRFLAESGVTRLVEELDAQLIAAERLADWYDERRRRSAEDARNVLLLGIGLFGVFGLASYLSLANGTSGVHRYTGFFQFLNLDPQREVHIVIGLFAFVLAVGAILLSESFWGIWRAKVRTFRAWVSRRRRRRKRKVRRMPPRSKV